MAEIAAGGIVLNHGGRSIDAPLDAPPIGAAFYDNDAVIALLQTHHNQLMGRLEKWLAEKELPAPSNGKIDVPTLPTSVSRSCFFDVREDASRSQATARVLNLASERYADALNPADRAARARATWQGALRWRVFSSWFDVTVSLLIFVNSVYVASEVEWEARLEEPAPWQFMIGSALFALFFLVELFLRIAAEGPKHFFTANESTLVFPPNASRSRGWNWFDTVLVISSMMEFMLLPAFGSVSTNVRVVRFFRLFRIARLIGLVRFVNVVPFICEVRVLMVSIVSTLSACFWAMALLIAIFFLFGVMFVQAVNDFFLRSEYLDCVPESELDEDVCLSLKKYWGNIPKAMLTLFESIFSGMDWSIASLPLQRVGPKWTFLFLIFIAFVYMAVLNTVTGAFVHSAIESVQRNREWLVLQLMSTKKQYAARIQDHFFAMFDRIDAERSGTFSLEEFERHLQEPQVKAYFALLDLETSDMYTLFKLLDRDGSNCVDVEAFIECSVRLKGQARSIDLAKLHADTKALSTRVARLTADMDNKMDACLKAVRALGGESRLSCLHADDVLVDPVSSGNVRTQVEPLEPICPPQRGFTGQQEFEPPEPSSCPPQRCLTGQQDSFRQEENFCALTGTSAKQKEHVAEKAELPLKVVFQEM